MSGAMSAAAAVPLPQQAGSGPRWTAGQSVAIAIAMAGAMLMGAIASGYLYPVPHHFVGYHLYDLYAQALFVEGRWDLPMRDLKLEGHFSADGTGYLYYGLLPLVTRLLVMPFVEFPTTWVSAFSMWFWAVLGTAAWHRAFWLAMAHGAGGQERIGGWASALLACAIWFAGPGLLLTASAAVFDEPIAGAFATTGGFALVLAHVAFGKLAIARAIVPMAVLAGLTVHARPHIAVGLYLAVCLIALALVRRGGWQAWRNTTLAMAILGAFGLALIAVNAVRFGDPTTVHGGFADEQVQYSSIFWGIEGKDSQRAVAFTEHGQFNLSRIVPNALVYFGSPPSDMGYNRAINALEALHVSLLKRGDSTTISDPKVGTLFLWPAWTLLMLVGLFQRDAWRTPGAAGIAGVGASAVLLLSYMTITLRYHIDLWPLLALPALFGLAAVVRKVAAEPKRERGWRLALLVLATLGLFVTLQKTVHLRAMNGDPYGMWSREYCLELAAGKGFAAARAQQICAKSSGMGGMR
jgi:hypothetical protein